MTSKEYEAVGHFVVEFEHLTAAMKNSMAEMLRNFGLGRSKLTDNSLADRVSEIACVNLTAGAIRERWLAIAGETIPLVVPALDQDEV